MKILVVNCGSSSLKYQLIDSETEQVLAKGLCERIGIDHSRIKAENPVSGKKKVSEINMPDHGVALQQVIEALQDPEIGAVKSLSEIGAVGHRVVHGGEYFHSSVLVTEDVIRKIEECSDLAPLHNPANLLGIRACQKLMPGVPQCVTFDTAFHQTMPKKAYLYGLPHRYYEEYKIRRYGFHGTSHSYVSSQALKYIHKPVEETKVIVCHLGGGASVTAVQGGKSVDTTMGLTPLEGLIMGTRSGSLDPAILQYIADKENRSVDDVLNILNKESGLLGMTDVSSDMRDIEDGYRKHDEKCTAAYEAFCYRIVKAIGGFVAAMNGVDLIAFTAGIGENDALVRSMVMKQFGYLGIQLDEKVNEETHGTEKRISTDDSLVQVYVIPTNEELAIARETEKLLK